MEETAIKYGELNETVFDAQVKKVGTSYAVLITRAMGMMGLSEGDMVRVTLTRIPTEE